MSRPRLAGLLAVLALLAVAVVVGTRSPDGSAAPDPGTARLQAAAGLAPCPGGLGPDLPDLALPCLGGGPDVQLDNPPPGPLLVNIWGTWCGPCVREVPLLVDLSRRAAGRVTVVGVLTEDTVTNGLTFAPQFGMTYANVVDDLAVVRGRYGAGTPLTLFIAADGTIVHITSGEIASAPELAELVATHLGVRV